MKRKDLISGIQIPKEELIPRVDDLGEDYFKKIIRDMGVKITKQRMGILEALSQGHAHVTAQELFERVQKIDPSTGFATVYRFLKKLSEHQYVNEVRMGGLPARYELSPKDHHDHLTCTQCGKIVEFENKDIEDLQLKVAHQFSFILTSHVLELYGICKDCQE